MQIKNIFFIFIFFIYTNLSANEDDQSLNALLDDFRIASDLSNQTKKEAGGSVIVFSRDKLEKMNALNLRDVLKTIPFFTLQEIMTGPVAMAKATGATFNSQYLKFYINDHELGSVVYGSAMKMWGYMDITHIDHIEVYQTGSSVSAGDEPTGMVIKLYTKDPKRDSGSLIQMVQSSSGSSEYNAYHAGTSNGLSYLMYLDVHNENRDVYRSGASDIKRDFDSINFFSSLSGDNFSINIANLDLEQDGFFGLGRMKQPADNYLDLKHKYITYTQYFQDKSLKLKTSYDSATHIRYDNDPMGIALNDGTVVNTWYYDKDEFVFDTSLSKKLTYRDNELEFGIQFKRKEYEGVSLLADGIERKDDFSDYNRLDIYSLFITDDIRIDENNLAFFTLKYDYHVHNSLIEDSDNYVARLGYIYNDENWLWKTFLIHSYGYPVFIENSYFPFVFMQNSSIKDEERYATATELHYKTEKTTSNIRFLFNMLKNGIALTPGKPQTYNNISYNPRFYGVYLSHEYNLDRLNKVVISGYTGNSNQDVSKSSNSGYMIQIFNTLGKVDLYNELIYKAGYSYSASPTTDVNVGDGYDYTISASYHITKDLTLSIKGENLLDKAIDTAYPILGRKTTEYLSPFDRTVRVGIKYVF